MTPRLTLIPPVAVPFKIGRLAAAMLARGVGSDRRFSEALAARVGGCRAILFSSGRAALAGFLRSCGQPGRDEVLVPAYTCWTVPASVVRAGLRVRLVDVDPDSLDFDREAFERAPTQRLAAVVAAHLFAPSCDIRAAAQILLERDPAVRLVEDAAQAWPVSRSSASCPIILSFGRGKPLPLGGGGALVFRSQPHANHLAPPGRGGGWIAALSLLAATHLGKPRYFRAMEQMPFLGIGKTIYDPQFDADAPFRAWQGRLGAGLLDELPGLIAARTRNAARLREHVLAIPGWSLTAACRADGPLRLPVLAPSRKARDSALKRLRRLGVGASPAYPGTLADISDLAPHLANPDEPVPGARTVAERLLTLPTYPGLRGRDLKRIEDALARVAGSER